MGFEDLKIRDLSHLSGVWTPPIGIMGGPPAHELYTDLVVFAGLQLYRDSRSRPVVVLRDGAQRRAFLAPSSDLRCALDRFRMRRNLRPLPDSAIDEFVRIVVARTSDPDVTIPLLMEPMVEQTATPVTEAPVSNEPVAPRFKEIEEQIDSALQDLDRLEAHQEPYPESTPVTAEPNTPEPEESPADFPAPPMNPSLSAARRIVTGPGEQGTRFIETLRRLVQDGGWMGTTRELSRLTKEDPISLFDSVLRYRAQLAENNILITNVEVEDGYRWLAVDRSRLRGSVETAQSEEPLLLAR